MGKIKHLIRTMRGFPEGRRARSAQVLLEFVILFPPILVVAAAVLHFGFLYYVLLSLHSAVSNAALFAAQNPSDNSAILGAVNASLPAIIDRSTVQRSVLFPGGRSFGSVGTLRVTYDVRFLRSLPLGAFVAVPTSVTAVLSFPVIAN